MRVLDTAALLHLPLLSLRGLVAHSQRHEVEALAPERLIEFEVAEIQWLSPSAESLSLATECARGTGDLAGLSPVDLDLLALAMESGLPLVTDDYRLQNCCKSAGLVYETVKTTGIDAQWEWKLVCSGCKVELDSRETDASDRKGSHGSCDRCGAPLRMRKR